MTASQSSGRRPDPRPDPAPGTPTTPGTSTGAGSAVDDSIGDLIKIVVTESSNLLRSELELAKLELRDTVKKAGIGIGMFVAAGLLLLFSLFFGFVTLAEGINATGLWRWLSFVIVFGAQLVIIATLLFLGRLLIRRARKPEETIRSTKETVDYLKKSRSV